MKHFTYINVLSQGDRTGSNTWIQSCPFWAQHVDILNVGGSKTRPLGLGTSVSLCLYAERERYIILVSVSGVTLNGLHLLRLFGIP